MLETVQTLKDLLPLISALGVLATAIFGVRTYKVQEGLKRETALAQRKEELYEKLVRNFVDLLVAKTPAHRSKLTTEIERGWLFASDKVLTASYAYLNVFDELCSPPGETEPISVEAVLNRIRSDPKIRRELSKGLARIFHAMREDIRPKTKIPEKWAIEQLRFYSWGAIADIRDLGSRTPAAPAP